MRTTAEVASTRGGGGGVRAYTLPPRYPTPRIPYMGAEVLYPPRKDLVPVIPSPLVDRQTPLKTLPSHNFNGGR